jgi:hypothetical protein
MSADELYDLYIAHVDACVWCAGNDDPRDLCTVGRDLRSAWMKAERSLPRRDGSKGFSLPQPALEQLWQARANLPE